MSWKSVVATPLDGSGVTAVGAADLGATVSDTRGASVSVSVGICNSETSFAAYSQAPPEFAKGCFRKETEQVRHRRHRLRIASLTR
jgi:hypothetical protein